MILVVVTLVALSTLATWPCEATPQGGWKAPSESDWTALLAGDIPYEEPETFTGEGNNQEENISRVGQSIETRVSGESSNALLGPGSFGYRHAQHLRWGFSFALICTQYKLCTLGFARGSAANLAYSIEGGL